MKEREIEKLTVFTAENPQVEKIHVSVYAVYRGNFNDERLIASKEFTLGELLGKPFVWFDLYLGQKKDNEKELAFVYANKRDLYFFEKDGGKVKLVKKNGFTHYYSDDYDEKYIISTQIW